MCASKHHSFDKFDNLDEMVKFVQHEIPKLTKKEMENVNGSTTSKEIESVIQKLPIKKSSGTRVFH